jgi:membrane-associated protease RseP (regulator of RpoE activity)
LSANGYPPAPAAYPHQDRHQEMFDASWAPARPRHRYWLHALLLLATLLTTTMVGVEMAHSFAAGRPFDFGDNLDGYTRLWHNPWYLVDGLPFSLTLLTILMAHEMGHYLTARYYNVDATLPFFLPAPTLIGTFGAFIRIRSAILSKRILFDIGVGGPLAGFAVLIPPLIVGVAMSKVVHSIGAHGEIVFGTPLIVRLFEWIIFPGVPVGDIYLHPVARAAWVGLLATALNLLPIGQLDGGHVLYAFLGEKTRVWSRFAVAMLAVLGLVQLFTSAYKMGYMWLFWAIFLLIFGMRHPAIVDPSPVGRTRTWLGILALVIFILSFTAAPIRTAGL